MLKSSSSNLLIHTTLLSPWWEGYKHKCLWRSITTWKIRMTFRRWFPSTFLRVPEQIVVLRQVATCLRSKIIESLSPAEAAISRNVCPPMPRQVLQLFLMTSLMKLILIHKVSLGIRRIGGLSTKIWSWRAVRWSWTWTLKAPIKHDLFIWNGRRMCEPQMLPGNLVGKTLFPTISCKNVTLRVNLGPEPMKSLLFMCRILSDAALAWLGSENWSLHLTGYQSGNSINKPGLNFVIPSGRWTCSKKNLGGNVTHYLTRHCNDGVGSKSAF